MTPVCLSRVSGYEGEALEQTVDIMFRDLGIYDRLKPGMTVVLKPNLVMASRPEAAAVTHPAVTRAVGRCVKKAGAKVLIAESPGGPYTPASIKAVFRACGYEDMAKESGFSLYTSCKSKTVSLPKGVCCRELSVVEPFLERDYLIDLAKLKTHGMVGFSGAVKNMFGVVPGLQKPELHCRFPQKEDFSQMLVDLCGFLKPDLCFLDGILAMEGNGPTGGNPRSLHALIASENPWAADVCGASLIGLSPESILHLKYGADRGLGPGTLCELDILGDDVETLSQPDFKRAKAADTDFIRRLPAFLRPAAKKLATPRPEIDRKKCVGCGKCAESCPQHIIEIKDGCARIHGQACIRCFCCHEMCPRQAVRVKRWRILRI